jgi:hypothetical protein
VQPITEPDNRICEGHQGVKIMEVYIKLTTRNDPANEKMLVRDILKIAKDVVNEGLSHRQHDGYFYTDFEVSAVPLR